MTLTAPFRHLTALPRPELLSETEWRLREAAHQTRADTLTAAWRARRQTGETHPIDDFLFTYYPYKPSLLRRWHPGAGVALENTAGLDRHEWRWYISVAQHPSALDASTHPARAAGPAASSTASTVDAAAYLAAKSATVAFLERLLAQTAARPARFSCFGLHEWAMVYHVAEGETRHESLPLRLTAEQTDTVVEQNRIACSHFDAFRFFTPDAIPTNELRPTRESQPDLEQPGCLHAGMDVYKWAIKLGPLVPGELLLDCFELARDIRQLDMRASPYDVSAYGLSPVRIETREGKRAYAEQQRSFADRSNALRRDLLAAIARARHAATPATSGS